MRKERKSAAWNGNIGKRQLERSGRSNGQCMADGTWELIV